LPDTRRNISTASQYHDGIVDLVNLDRAVHEQPEVANAEADDLDGIFQAKCVVHKHELINEAEDIKCQERWDRFRLFGVGGRSLELELEGSENISLE
jgi:hypothetical protein